MPRSTTLLGRGLSVKAAFRALAIELDTHFSDDPDDVNRVVVIQARASHDGSGFIAEAAIWHLKRYSEMPPEVEPRPPESE